MNLLYRAISHRGVNDVAISSSVPQSVIDKAVDQWHTRLCACVKAKGHHFEYLLQMSVDCSHDLTGSFDSHSQISQEDSIQNRKSFFFVVNVFSGSVATELR